jgi:ABC-type multidrug transport system fused ATPase/permease subunit
MRYRPTLEPSVRNLNFEIQAGMKVGIVGRTGAGKSSILQILFRLVDPSEGSVEIDGIDIKNVGLHLLRKNIAYIP